MFITQSSLINYIVTFVVIVSLPSAKVIHESGHQKIAILIRTQFLNDIIKSRHGFKTAQKFHKFRVLIKNSKFMKFLNSFKAMS